MPAPKVMRMTISIVADNRPADVTERVAYDAYQALSGWLDAMGRAGVPKGDLVAAIVSRALLETTDIDTLP